MLKSDKKTFRISTLGLILNFGTVKVSAKLFRLFKILKLTNFYIKVFFVKFKLSQNFF